MEYYDSNMRLLKKKSKKLYNKINNYHQSDKLEIDQEVAGDVVARIKDLDNELVLDIEEARRGGYTLKVKSNDKENYFHSKYAPKKEGKKLVDNLELRKNNQVFLLGVGLGHHLCSLVDNGRFDRVFVIEPFLAIFYAALLYQDLSKALKNKKLILLVDEQENLYPVLRGYYQVTIHKAVKFFEHAPSLNLFKKDYKTIYEKVKSAIRYNHITIATNIKDTRKWRNNMIFNLRYILKSPKVDNFFSAFEGIPAICVSAGPSLDKNIDQLKKAKGKALIMCVGTALKALLQAGIEPDIVVTMDGKKANYKHFKDIEVPKESFLFTEKANHYLINRKWTDKQVYFTMKRNLSSWVEDMRGNYTSIQTGGTVAHSMVDLAYKMGANPIALVGQDLAYGSEGETHASGTRYGKKTVGGKKLFEVEDINGNKVKTSKTFKSFLDYFNDYFSKRQDRTFIDATEGGAKIEHTKIMTLENVINQYCKEEYSPREVLKNIYQSKINTNEDNIKEYEKEIAETIKELDSAIEITEEQLSEIAKIENKLKLTKFSDDDTKEVNKKMKFYEYKLKRFKRVKYFIERILIVETLKHKEINNKFYMDEQHKLKEKMKYYRTYRVRYLKELKKCLKLIKGNYTKKTEIKNQKSV